MLNSAPELQTYNDGLVDIYEAVAPRTIAETKKYRLCFERQTVGVKRFYAAQQANVQVAHVLRCPRREDVSTQDIAVLDGHKYRIGFVQYPKKVSPPSMDLTLEEVRGDYDAND